TMRLATADLAAGDWSLTAEAEVLRAALEPLEQFHVVAASGGATVVLRHLADRHRPERLRSLTLIEPPWVGLDAFSDSERAFVAEFDRLITLPPRERWAAFAALYSPG